MLATRTLYVRRMRSLGDLVSEARARKGWTQEEAAERLGVKRNWLAQLETDRIDLPGPEYLEILERHYGVSREEMLRAAGYLGPPLAYDLLGEMRRIAAIDDLEERIEALRQLPPEVFLVIEAAAHGLLRRSVRQDRQGMDGRATPR